MTFSIQILLYSAVILTGALAGAWIPLLVNQKTRLLGLLSFASGIMLGAAFFHMLPEAFHGTGDKAFVLVPLGFITFFLLERYVLVHACEEPPDCPEHVHGQTLGMAALLGLSVHTLFDGVALAAAVSQGIGMMALVAIFAHKVPSSFSLATILKTEGQSPARIGVQTIILGLMVPLGASLYWLLGSAIALNTFAPGALAFSAGTFLYISVSDLLPNVTRHGSQGKFKHILGLTAGMGLMWLLTFVSKHSH